MKTTAIILIAAMTVFAEGFAEEKEANEKTYVYIFLENDCRISQFYCQTLSQLHEDYASGNLVFIGVFPNQKVTGEDMEKFKNEFDIPFELTFDKNQALTDKLGATVTPEAVVYNQNVQEVIYRGRIDDSYARVGRKKGVPRSFELKAVLEQLKNGEKVDVKWQPAVGCFITKK